MSIRFINARIRHGAGRKSASLAVSLPQLPADPPGAKHQGFRVFTENVYYLPYAEHNDVHVTRQRPEADCSHNESSLQSAAQRCLSCMITRKDDPNEVKAIFGGKQIHPFQPQAILLT